MSGFIVGTAFNCIQGTNNLNIKTMKNKHLIDRLICTVSEYNNNSDEAYKEYCRQCKTNGVDPLPFNRYFHKFPYKVGFVSIGKYPIYRKTKKELINLLNL